MTDDVSNPLQADQPVAELVPCRTLRDLLPQLEALRASLPAQAISGVEIIRALRDKTGSRCTTFRA